MQTVHMYVILSQCDVLFIIFNVYRNKSDPECCISFLVMRSGHCAIPGHLPQRSHHAGHCCQRQIGGDV